MSERLGDSDLDFTPGELLTVVVCGSLAMLLMMTALFIGLCDVFWPALLVALV